MIINITTFWGEPTEILSLANTDANWSMHSERKTRRTVMLLIQTNIQMLSNILRRLESLYDIQCFIRKKGYDCLDLVNTRLLLCICLLNIE